MIRFFSKISFLFLLATYGCHVSSKVALEGQGGRTAYNISIQNTNAEEMLLNLVRLRYYDCPFFMEVGNVTTQFTYKSLAAPKVPIPGFNKDNPFILGGEFSWQNQPTIQYSPLEGHSFATQLMQPIDLSTIQQIIYSGWDIDRVFRLVVQSFDELFNTPIGSGPAPVYEAKYKSFFEATHLMRYFQLKGVLQVGIKVVKKEDDKQNNENGEEILQIAFPKEGEEAERLADLLGGIETRNGKYILNMLQGFNDRGQIGVMPRSLLSCIYYLGQGVDVPDNDIRAGRVSIPVISEGEYRDWQEIIHKLITIKSSNSRPNNSYISIKYRGHWFYIDDSDLESKRTFLLLLQLYTLQSIQEKIKPPLLTLPLG